MNIEQAVDALRKQADALEGAVDSNLRVHIQDLNIVVEDADEMALYITTIGGKWMKVATANYFCMDRDLGGTKISVFASREDVCERVVTGTEEIQVPDPDAPMVTKIVETSVWVCPDSLLRLANNKEDSNV